MKINLMPLAGLCLALGPVTAGTVSLSGPLTTDASSLISPANTYTHAISGGTAATVNGVNFELLSSTVTPANFSWVSNNGGNKADIVGSINGINTWNPAAGGVVGPGLHSAGNTGLLDSFTYAPQGADVPSSQTFTLSGLIIGTTYDARIYIRSWDHGGSGRPITFTMTNGAEVDSFGGPEDQPGTVLGTGNQDQAFFVNYRYTAQGTSLLIDAAVSAGAPANSGSFHTYALSNQVVPEPTTAASLALALGLLGSVRRRRS